MPLGPLPTEMRKLRLWEVLMVNSAAWLACSVPVSLTRIDTVV